MFSTVVKFVGLPVVAASAAVMISAGAASAQRSDAAPPRVDLDVVADQCMMESAGYSQFLACVVASLES
ncbi:hypothetical protein [Nocardia jinanensis]|uniref:Uncharacterized protein n=1 Tax=Nocardia jinanensis TaxID=382504 RepID=A0A917RI30_9NOCA|nr:hypothetical protein [Nocardia jinanensis]GGL06962.1 hypothetical protein GCM10011588_21750 [Nocardia jinanensis]